MPAMQILADSRSHLSSKIPEELGSDFGDFQSSHGDSFFSDAIHEAPYPPLCHETFQLRIIYLTTKRSGDAACRVGQVDQGGKWSCGGPTDGLS